MQEIVIFMRIENMILSKSFTSTKQIRVDFVDTGNAEKTKTKLFPSMIWTQVEVFIPTL